ncbi:MAG: YwmB family TATA-box binding protein [Thermosediminibacteraceae bacterium]|nr:YwmB family TATA-box binding protein [Thermosediminibacteraceae bacterium]
MKIFALALFFMLLTPLTPLTSLSMDEEDLVMDAFTATRAQIEAFDIADWSVINRNFMDFSDMKQIAENVFGIFKTDNENYSLILESDDMYRTVILEGMLHDGNHVRVIVQSVKLPEEYEKKPQTYLAVNVTGKDVKIFKQTKRKVVQAITSNGGQSRITTCLSGAFYGKLNQIERDKIIGKIRERLYINDFEKIEDLEMQNLVGYSPLISDRLEIMGKSYNVNIAMRYSAEDDKTYIWMGVPVISIEY